MTRLIYGTLLAAVALLCAAATASASQRIHVRPLVKTNLPLGDVVWADERLLYVAEHTGAIDESGPRGERPRPFAALPREGEEVRCVPAPTGNGFPLGLYCHTAANNIYRVTATGRIHLFARLPERRTSDGALTFDTSGRFGFALLAATGRSNDHHGGAVYTINPRGTVTKLGSYPGPGGAENAAIAPRGFGPSSGDLLLTTDTPSREGRLLAIDPHGQVFTIATIHGDGLNSLTILPRRWGGRKSGVVIADTRSRIAWLIPATLLRPFAGDVLVAAELRGWIYVVKPANGDDLVVRLKTNLTGSQYNLEGATAIP